MKKREQIDPEPDPEAMVQMMYPGNGDERATLPYKSFRDYYKGRGWVLAQAESNPVEAPAKTVPSTKSPEEG